VTVRWKGETVVTSSRPLVVGRDGEVESGGERGAGGKRWKTGMKQA
jgi:hypothetical protein